MPNILFYCKYLKQRLTKQTGYGILINMDIVMTALRQAYISDRPVVIVYLSKDGISQRRIYVRQLSKDILVAYCTKRKSLRKFRISNILSAIPAEEE